MWTSLLSIAAIVAILGCANADNGATGDLVRVFVVHRHGARTPLVWANQAELCGSTGCGTLTKEGSNMLRSLGKHVKKAYNASGSNFLKSTYDSRQIVSISTNYARTVQSSASFVEGLMNSTSVLPFIETVPKDEEALLRPDKGWPGLVLHNRATETALWSQMDNVTLKYISKESLSKIGEEAGFGAECDPTDKQFSPYVCALDAQDLWECSYSEGTAATKFPILNAESPKLNECLRASNDYSWYLYDQEHSPEYLSSIGTYGQFLAQDIIERAEANSAASSPYGEGPDPAAARVVEYSGHDVTLMTLQDTLGNRTLLHPRFGNAMTFAITNDTGKLWISAALGTPQQSPNPDPEYTFDKFVLRCTTQAGVTDGFPDGCPLDDFKRYIATRGGRVDDVKCFAPLADLEAEGCSYSSDKAPAKHCQEYRRLCPFSSCGAEHFLSADLKCNSVTATKAATSKLKGAVIILACLAAVGAVGWLMLPMMRKKASDDAASHSLLNGDDDNTQA